MEVHTHTHTPRRKWTHYIWEFLMLFLAVFCGFLAENQREHYVEHQREKQYIRSMIEDLKTDTLNLNDIVKGLQRKSLELDSVLVDFDEGAANYNYRWAQLFIRSYRAGYPDFFPTDRTIQQLKNAGGLRLIRSESASKGIVSYDALVKDVTGEETNISEAQKKYIDQIMKTWSIKKMYKDAGITSWTTHRTMVVKNNYWLTNDPIAKEQVFNTLSDYNEAMLRQIIFDRDLKKEAIALIELLKKEYHL
ncbi:MAG TPA: hypothetical protein VF476_02615 [Chitinophagaceae bacterium]